MWVELSFFVHTKKIQPTHRTSVCEVRVHMTGSDRLWWGSYTTYRPITPSLSCLPPRYHLIRTNLWYASTIRAVRITKPVYSLTNSKYMYSKTVSHTYFTSFLPFLRISPQLNTQWALSILVIVCIFMENTYREHPIYRIYNNYNFLSRKNSTPRIFFGWIQNEKVFFIISFFFRNSDLSYSSMKICKQIQINKSSICLPCNLLLI